MSQSQPRRLRITLVVEVLDNFGDAGISWRLACQLADEWQADVTIAIDQPDLLKLWQAKRQARQFFVRETGATVAGITVTQLHEPLLTRVPGDKGPDLLIAMLGSNVPSALREQIREHRVKWVRYEYLTAESWVDDFHALASVKPDDGLTEWFYYPGYTATSGGLLRESDLLEELHQFSSTDALAHDRRSQWLIEHGLTSPDGHFRVCLFGYAEQATQRFVDALLSQPQPITLFISQSLASGLALDAADPRLRLHPWLDQPDFDRLLASCDLSIVRGEDSWLRAQWTGQPMFWQPYRQADAGHLNKLAGYLDRLLANAEPDTDRIIRQAMLSLNERGDPACALPAWFAHLDQVRLVHQQWRDELAAQSSLSERLLSFCRDQLQLPV